MIFFVFVLYILSAVSVINPLCSLLTVFVMFYVGDKTALVPLDRTHLMSHVCVRACVLYGPRAAVKRVTFIQCDMWPARYDP